MFIDNDPLRHPETDYAPRLLEKSKPFPHLFAVSLALVSSEQWVDGKRAVEIRLPSSESATVFDSFDRHPLFKIDFYRYRATAAKPQAAAADGEIVYLRFGVADLC